MKRQPLLLLFFLSLMAVSCSVPRYIYAPSIPVTPFFEEKGEASLSGNYATPGQGDSQKSSGNGFDLQGAYAVTSKLAITANFSQRREKEAYSYIQDGRYDIFDSSVIKYRRQMFEAGIGYVVPVDRLKTVYLGVFAGIGGGKLTILDQGLDNNSSGYSRTYENRLLKWYLQPAFNAHAGRYFRFSLAWRLSFVRYGSPRTSYTEDELKYYDFDRIHKRILFLSEPSTQMQFIIPDLEWLRLDGGLIFCSDPHKSRKLKSRFMTPFVGLSFHVPSFSRRQKKEDRF
ncbi:MAG: porin family protein [Chitinophagaceae bacterium]|nr:porin family protein [Chitinophagaceae bacterium]